MTQQNIDSPQTGTRKRGLSWWAPRLVGIAVVAVAIIIGGQMLSIYSAARSDDTGPADAIVVLGAAQFNGAPSAVFKARLDTALELYQQGAANTIIVTGGRLPGDQFTEAESGRNYLVSMGVPAESILMEHLSSNTAQSIDRVAGMLDAQGMQSVLIVSDGFHLYRAALLGEEHGLSVQSNDADSSPIRQGSSTEFRYIVRETFAVLAHYLGID